MTQRDTAERIGVKARTLRRWQRQWRGDRLGAHPRGRPRGRAGRERRREVWEWIDRMGPRVGLPTLRGRFPEVARAELVRLQRFYRRWWRRKHRRLIHRLTWTRPGTVWAADFAHVPRPIDGCFPRLLAVRDLASHAQLQARPALGEDVATAREVLEDLVRRHGPPLVLKTDNGPAFVSAELQAWADHHGVRQLFSPPRTPSYNGSIEAGIRSLKARAHHEAFRRGRPGHWSSEDLGAARRQANATARPWGWRGPTPAEVWQERSRIEPWERHRWQQIYRRMAEEERQRRRVSSLQGLSHAERATIDRRAIRRTLVAHGLLWFRRSRISPPIFS